MSIGDEEIASIEAILFRLTLLAKSRDITEVMEDEEGGQSSGWEIVCAFAERGELPYKDEAKVSGRARVEDMGMTDGADYRTCHPSCLFTLDVDVQEF
jgi:hypothetical protein